MTGLESIVETVGPFESLCTFDIKPAMGLKIIGGYKVHMCAECMNYE